MRADVYLLKLVNLTLTTCWQGKFQVYWYYGVGIQTTKSSWNRVYKQASLLHHVAYLSLTARAFRRSAFFRSMELSAH